MTTKRTSSWFDEASHTPIIGEQAQRLASFLTTMADGKVDDAASGGIIGYNLDTASGDGAILEMAPIADLPVLEVISAVHILSDLTLPLGTVAYDYLAK